MSKILFLRHHLRIPTRTIFSVNKVNIEFVNRSNEVFNVKAREGDSILDTVMDNDIEFDGFGVCGGGIACSTCHVVLDDATYQKIELESEEEFDMLDNACGLTETSRLGCCVKVSKDMEGAKISIPAGEDARITGM